jgi:hypothetical protein
MPTLLVSLYAALLICVCRLKTLAPECASRRQSPGTDLLTLFLEISMYRPLAWLVMVIASVSFAAAPLAEKFAKRVATIEEAYATAATKADNAKFFALQKANSDRIKGLRLIMSEATKAGDFETASALKDKIVVAEKEGNGYPKPKNVIKFGGHEFAVMEEKVTWHVAKRRCEEMGGHLACLKSAEEVAFGFSLYQKLGSTLWIGGTDEENEGAWRWVDGSPLSGTVFEQRKGTANHLAFGEGKLLDGDAGARCAFLCEWDK